MHRPVASDTDRLCHCHCHCLSKYLTLGRLHILATGSFFFLCF